MTNYSFTEMNETYLDDVLAIYTHYVLHSTATFHIEIPTREEMHEIVFFKKPQYKTYVILDNNRVCGYVLLTEHKKREAYSKTAEVTIYLHPDYSGQGLGSLALKHIETYAKTQDLHVLVATICGDNQASLSLFHKNGYEKCAHYKEVGQKFGKWLDLVAYQKIIS